VGVTALLKAAGHCGVGLGATPWLVGGAEVVGCSAVVLGVVGVVELLGVLDVVGAVDVPVGLVVVSVGGAWGASVLVVGVVDGGLSV
jgi:hypothetical protein